MNMPKITSKTPAPATKPALAVAAEPAKGRVPRPAPLPAKKAVGAAQMLATIQQNPSAAPTAEQEAPTSPPEAGKKAGAPSVRVRQEVQLSKLLKLAGRIHARLQHWDPACAEASADLVKAAEAALGKVRALPTSYTPPKGSGGGPVAAPLAEGVVVDVVERALGTYAGILEPAQLSKLVVKKVAGNKVRVTAADGATLIFPRGHLRASPSC